MAYNVGLTGPFDYEGAIQNDFFASVVNFMPNRTPLVTRLPNRRIAGTQVKAIDSAFRPSSTRLTDANGILNSNTTLTLTESAAFMIGDVIQIGSEQMLITAVNAANNTVTVTRGYASTTAAAANTNSVAHLVSNTRTGAEVDVDAGTYVLDNSITYPQTVQHPYQVGGSLEASSPNMAIPMGMSSFLGYQRAMAAQETLDDFERAIYYGRAVALAADTTRPQMRGIRQRLATNITTSPTNASGYKPSDLERDLFQTAYAGGGMPDLLVCATDWRAGFATWGVNLMQLRPGDTAFGVPIEVWNSPGLGAINILFAPLLRSGAAFTLTSSEVYMGWKREPFDKPRGSRGDALEGDIIGEGCVIVNNESHHAWVEGVTGFAKQS
jgi:hypothetical protein